MGVFRWLWGIEWRGDIFGGDEVEEVGKVVGGMVQYKSEMYLIYCQQSKRIINTESKLL